MFCAAIYPGESGETTSTLKNLSLAFGATVATTDVPKKLL